MKQTMIAVSVKSLVSFIITTKWFYFSYEIGGKKADVLPNGKRGQTDIPTRDFIFFNYWFFINFIPIF